MLFNNMGSSHMKRQSSAFLQLGASDLIPLAPILGGGGLPSLMAPKPKIKTKVEMKAFHWKHLRDNQIAGTIWTEISKIEENMVKKDQIDGNEENKVEDDDNDEMCLDNLCTHLEANNVDTKFISDFKSFVNDNEYDSEALNGDIDDYMDYKYGSNVYEFCTDKKHFQQIRSFMRKQNEKVKLQTLEELFPKKEKKKRNKNKKEQ